MSIPLAVVELLALLAAACGLAGPLIPEGRWFTDRWPTLVMRTGAGLGLIAFLTLGAAALGIAGLPFWLGVLVAGLALFLRDLRHRGRPARPAGPRSVWEWLLSTLVVINAFYSLFPPTFYDSMVYHLAVPAYYLQHGGLVPWERNFYAALPQTAEMLNLFSLLGGSVLVPKLLQFAASLLLLAWLLDWQKQAFPGQAAGLAALAVFSVPEWGFAAASTKNDMLGLLFMLVAARLLLEGLEEWPRSKRRLVASGLFWGLACATKYIFAFYLAGFVPVVLGRRPRYWRSRFGALLCLGAALVLVMLPGMVKNAALTGNPVYPYLNGIFSSPYWSAAQQQNLDQVTRRGEGPLQALAFLVAMFRHPYAYDVTAVEGVALPALLLLLPFAWRRRRSRRLLSAGLLGLGLMLLAARVPRYFLGAFLLLALPAADGVLAAGERRPLLKKLIPPLLLALFAVNLVQQLELQERFSFGISHLVRRARGDFAGTDATYLDHLPYWRAAGFVNRTLGPGDRIAFLGEDRSFYFEKETLVSSFNDRNPVLDCLKESRDLGGFRSALGRMGITHILFSLPGLEMLSRYSVTHRLPAAERGRLLSYLNRFPLLYSDARYRVYRVPLTP